LLKKKSKNNNKKCEDYEIAEDAVSLDGELADDIVKIGILDETDQSQMRTSVNGREEFPASSATTSVVESKKPPKPKTKPSPSRFSLLCRKNSSKLPSSSNSKKCDLNGNDSVKSRNTLPKMKKPNYNNLYIRMKHIDHVPKRRTPDGTDIYYWCDYHPKKLNGKGALSVYNPLTCFRGLKLKLLDERMFGFRALI
jgi:hypothetical protein